MRFLIKEDDMDELQKKVLLKILQQQKEIKQDLDYVSEFIVLLNEKVDHIIKKFEK